MSYLVLLNLCPEICRQHEAFMISLRHAISSKMEGNTTEAFHPHFATVVESLVHGASFLFPC